MSRTAQTTDRRPLSPAEIDAAGLDAAVFTHRHCMIRPDARGGRPIPFRLWPAQVDLMREFEDRQRLIVLKARQLGISWLADAYALWLCSMNHGQTVLILSKGLREAKVELERVKFMHQRLPPELKRSTGRTRAWRGIERTDQLEFPEMDSRIISLPATADIGTAFTATLVLMQELAKMPHAASALTAVEATVSAGGQLFLISTMKGYDGPFFDFWMDAVPQLSEHWEPGADDSEYTPIFLPSGVRPGRDDEWRRRQRRKMLSDRHMGQEYPETWQEAIQLAGEGVFSEDFDRARHSTNQLRSPDSPWPVVRSIDFGLHFSPVHWHEVIGERLVHTFAELDAREMTTEELAKAIVAREREMGLKTDEIESAVDPAGGNRNTQTKLPDVDILERFGIAVITRDGKLERVAPDVRVDQMKGLLQHDRWLINPQACPRLVEALERAEWDRHGLEGPLKETYKKDGRYEHYLDGVGYGMINIFPIDGVATASETSSDAVGPWTPGFYSDSEFG